MTSRQKRKGDQAERDLVGYLKPHIPLVRRTKAGGEKDLGDLSGVVDADGDLWCVSVKDRVDAAPNRIERAVREAEVMAERLGVIFYVVVWKRPRASSVGRWYVWMPMQQLVEAIGARVSPGASVGEWSGLACITVDAWLEMMGFRVDVVDPATA